MERLHELLADKVQREHLSKSSTETAMAGKTAPAKICWLCGCEARLRYRLKDTSSLCFSCFRTAYIALVLPFIDTPVRRKSDAKLLAEIDRVRDEVKRSNSTIAQDLAEASLGNSAIFDPSQASFVMSASLMRQRLQSSVYAGDAPGPAGAPGAAGGDGAAAQKLYWNCPRCTYVNPLLAKRCEACGFANSTTVKCRICGAHCPLDPEAGNGRGKSVCSNGKPHVTWCCGECGEINTLDGDECIACKRPRYWACSYCTALHSVSRAKDGLRYCPTCGSYNTPDDVQKGQEKIAAEQKRADMAAAAQQQQQHESSAGGQAAGGGKEVVFGVNDAGTLAEQQRQKDIEANMHRLNARLDSLHIRRISQKSDGNCLFSALAHQLFGNQQLHYLVRSCVVAYMRENAGDYMILFDGDAEWREYLNKMKETGNWGDELCINAASRCFCVNIHLITSHPERWHMVFQHDELGKSETNLQAKIELPSDESMIASPLRAQTAPRGESARTHDKTLCLFLAYLFPVHFDDVTPTDVPSVVLSDLMLPELHKMLTNEGGSAPSKSPAPQGGSATSTPHPAEAARTSEPSRPHTHHEQTPQPPGETGLGSSGGAARKTLTPRPQPLEPVASLHSEQQQQHRGSAVSTTPTIERPSVPRTRGPNSSPPPTAGGDSPRGTGTSAQFLAALANSRSASSSHLSQSLPPPPPSHHTGGTR